MANFPQTSVPLSPAPQTGFSQQRAVGRLPAPLPDPLYLNLGCGLDVREGFVNIDLYSDDPRVVGIDVRQLALPDNCADGIIASDILEHFSHQEVETVLREWARVLKPGAELALRCPSLRLQAKAYLRGDWSADIAAYMIFGGQTNPGDYHCAGFDEISIRRHLARVGLAVFSVEEHDVPQPSGHYINLNMSVYARKVETAATLREPPRQPSVVWEGPQFLHYSLANVNRELCLQLTKAPAVDLSIVPDGPPQFGVEVDPRFEVLAQAMGRPLAQPADVHVRHQWPPNFNPPPAGHWVMIQPWEYGSLPTQWINAMLGKVDEVWAYTQFVRDCYVASGWPAERVRVVPVGVDGHLFKLGVPPLPLPTQKRFKFLFVGGTIWRKGPDVLLNAYLSAFSVQDDVCLIIKGMGEDTFYQGQTATERIRQAQSRPEAPEIIHLTENMAPRDLPQLYAACDCLVHPYRGEGFGLPIAEAMACGLPVIVTGAGACLDYCDETVAYLISAQKKCFSEKRAGPFETADFPFIYEPDPDHTARLMRHVFDHPADARELGQRAAQRIHADFSWEAAGQKVRLRLEALRDKPVWRLRAAEAVADSGERADRAATTLRQLLEAEDLETTLKELAGAFDAELLALVQQNAEVACREGDPELAEGLENLAAYIAQTCATPQPVTDPAQES
jgi:glycosyltransferase involved in cell wall biosynthesis